MIVGIRNNFLLINVLLFFALSGEGFSIPFIQVHIDSLVLAKNTGDSSLQMRLYYTLGDEHREKDNFEISQAYYDSAYTLAKATNDDLYQGRILFRRGQNYHSLGAEIPAFESFRESIEASKLADNFKTMGSAYSLMGSIFRVNGMYDRAIEYNIKSKHNYEKSGYDEGNAWVAYLLGRIYHDLKRPQKALDYYFEALEKYKVMASADGNENGVAICHEQIGLLNWEAGNFIEAKKHVDTVLSIHRKGESEYGISNSYKHMGKISYSIGNYSEADEYLRQALDMKNKIGDVPGQSGIYEYLGLSLIKQGRVEEGFNHLQQGLNLALTHKQTRILLDIYTKISEAYQARRNFEKAVHYQNLRIQTQDSILSNTASIKVEQLQKIYELDDQKVEIEKLERENNINTLKIKQHHISQLIMIVGIFLALIIAVVIYMVSKKIHQKNLELREANRTKDKLFSIIAHDLRGPLGSILGLSELLSEDVQSQDVKAIDIKSSAIHQSLVETNSLLNNLLQWAATQLQHLEFRPEWLHLVELITEVEDQLSFQATKKNLRIKSMVDSSVQLFGDPDMLKSILRNLVSNSIKFSNQNGEIIISASVKETGTEISVRDTGIGMKQEIVDKLFELEANISRPGTMGEKGTGLGLILAKEFVEKHGGEISVNSEADKGSDFRFTIPE